MNPMALKSLSNCDICLPLYFARKPLKAMEFYVYDINLISRHLNKTVAEVCHTALRQLNRKKTAKGYHAYTDRLRVYTRKEIEPDDLSYEFPKEKSQPEAYAFSLVPAGKETVPFTNQEVYESFVEEQILRIFWNRNDYRIRDNRVLTPSILTNFDAANPVFSSVYNTKGQRAVRMDREISFSAHVFPDGRYCLQIDHSIRLINLMSIFHLLQDNGIDWLIKNKIRVKNKLPTASFSGIIVPMPTDFQKYPWAAKSREELVENYRSSYAQNPVIQKFASEVPDTDTPVAVQTKSGKILICLTSALERVLSNDVVSHKDYEFSKIINRYKKLNMRQRCALDQITIAQISYVGALDTTFVPEPVLPEHLGYRLGQLYAPDLLVGNGQVCPTIKKKLFFQEGYGYFQSPVLSKDHLRIAILAREEFCNRKEGKQPDSFLFSRLLEAYLPRLLLSNGLLANLPFASAPKEEQKRLLKSYFSTKVFQATPRDVSCEQFIDDFLTPIKEEFKPDVYLVILPYDPKSPDDEEKPDWHSVLEGHLTRDGIAAQGLTEKHAIELCIQKRQDTLRYFKRSVPDCIFPELLHGCSAQNAVLTAQNINMGILSKLGGVPFVAKNMPQMPDLFIGIDVGMSPDGMHYPACSVACFGNGKLLGFIQPQDAIPGEKIPKDALYQLLNEIISEYKRQNHGAYPKSIIITATASRMKTSTSISNSSTSSASNSLCSKSANLAHRAS